MNRRQSLALAIACIVSVTTRPVGAQERIPVTPTDSAQLTSAQLDSARREGEALGAKQGGWFGRAYAVGVFSNVIGSAVVVPIAATSEPEPRAEVRQQRLARGPEYQAAFERGYSRAARRKRVWTSVVGALLGIATNCALFIIS